MAAGSAGRCPTSCVPQCAVACRAGIMMYHRDTHSESGSAQVRVMVQVCRAGGRLALAPHLIPRKNTGAFPGPRAGGDSGSAPAPPAGPGGGSWALPVAREGPESCVASALPLRQAPPPPRARPMGTAGLCVEGTARHWPGQPEVHVCFGQYAATSIGGITASDAPQRARSRWSGPRPPSHSRTRARGVSKFGSRSARKSRTSLSQKQGQGT